MWVAWVGVFTTAVNTAIPMLLRADLDPATAQALRDLREPVLLLHAIATLLPMLGLALVGFPRSPFAAVAAAAFTGMEKIIELVGQALRAFPPEEVLGGVPVREVVAAVWDQLFFVLWLCNTCGAAAAGFLLLRLVPVPQARLAAAFAWSAAALTLLMMLGADYMRWPVPSVPAWLFFLVFTGYRLAIAMALMRASSSIRSGV
jgi:hypothetical protein